MRQRIVPWFSYALFLSLGLANFAAAQSAQLGRSDFPTSGSADAQQHFIRGVLLLHSFEYGDAAEAFREAQSKQPDFAMAYWGEAMTYNHPVWQQQDSEAARAVLKRLAPTAEARLAKAPTEREKDYLRALEVLYGDGEKQARDDAYAEAMRRLHEKYPDDPEAATFYALALLGTAHEGRDVPTYMRAAALAEEVFRDYPEHPGAVHYLIHSYDDPVHAPLGLRAAHAYSRIAPAASHAQHMTSHIFVALGMWDEVVAANETSWQVAAERVKRKGLSVDAHNFHALRWLAYGYVQQGRYEAARELLGKMRDYSASSGSPRSRTYIAQIRSDYVVNTGRWDDKAVGIEIDVSGLGPATASNHLFAEGLAALQRGDRVAAEAILVRLAELGSLERSAADAYPPDLQAARIIEKELGALIALEDGKAELALAQIEQATDSESDMPFEFGPPFIVKPSHELKGEILLALGRAAEAQSAFEVALTRTPRRTAALLGLARAAERAGDRETAQETYAMLRAIWQRADAALPELREVASR